MLERPEDELDVLGRDDGLALGLAVEVGLEGRLHVGLGLDDLVATERVLGRRS